MDITILQRKYLRRLANTLKPNVMLGKQGLTEQLIGKIGQELDAHELIKVRLLEFKDEKQKLAKTMVDETGAALVSIVGNVITLYRENPEREEGQINLPQGGRA